MWQGCPLRITDICHRSRTNGVFTTKRREDLHWDCPAGTQTPLISRGNPLVLRPTWPWKTRPSFHHLFKAETFNFHWQAGRARDADVGGRLEFIYKKVDSNILPIRRSPFMLPLKGMIHCGLNVLSVLINENSDLGVTPTGLGRVLWNPGG
jgi:hypothetical protein